MVYGILWFTFSSWRDIDTSSKDVKIFFPLAYDDTHVRCVRLMCFPSLQYIIDFFASMLTCIGIVIFVPEISCYILFKDCPVHLSLTSTKLETFVKSTSTTDSITHSWDTSNGNPGLRCRGIRLVGNTSIHRPVLPTLTWVCNTIYTPWCSQTKPNHDTTPWSWHDSLASWGVFAHFRRPRSWNSLAPN